MIANVQPHLRYVTQRLHSSLQIRVVESKLSKSSVFGAMSQIPLEVSRSPKEESRFFQNSLSYIQQALASHRVTVVPPA